MWSIEVTDTFGGESNYSWVRRHQMESGGASDLSIVRRAKKIAGWDGYRCNTTNYGDGFELRPTNGDCVVMFITWQDE